MPVRSTGKPPIAQYVALAALLAATTVYHLRTIESRFPQWLGKSTVVRPFYIPEVELGSNGTERNHISFVRREAYAAGVRNGDRLLTVNGAPVTGIAVYGEALRKARPGDKISITVARQERDGTTSEKAFDVPVWPVAHSWPRDIPSALIIGILPFFSVVLGFWVAFVRPHDARAWFLLALMLNFEAFFDPGVESWGPWARDLGVVLWVGAKATFPLWLMLFAIYFPEPFPAGSKRASRWKWLQWAFVIPFGLLAVAVIVMYIGDLESYNSVEFLRRLPKPVIIAIVSLTYIAIGQALGAFLIKYKTAVSRDSRRRLRLLFFASIVTLTPLLIVRCIAIIGDFNIETDFPEWLWWSSYFLFFLFPVALAYIILVERAMDVRLVLRQGLQYALAKNGIMGIRLVATAVVLLAGVALISSRGRNRLEEIAIIIAGVIAVFTIRRVAEKLKSWTDHRFFREAYDAEHVLSELSDHVRRIVEPQPLLATVVGRISETLHVPQIAVMLDAGSPYKPAYALGYEGLSGIAFSSESATIKVLQSKKEPVRVYFDDAASWIYRDGGATEAERGALASLHAELLLPLSGRDKLLGFISLGPKRSEEPFTGSDLRLLKSVATQTGLALENAQLVAAITEEVKHRERLNREVEIAREVQERLFPQELPPIAGLDYSGACRPALGVGGDYYDFLALPQERLGVAIGDVSGKGIGAALMMASLQASLRAEATRNPEDLSHLMSNVNRLVYQASTSNRYATFFYGQYDSGNHQLIYVNAGHNSPMLLRRTEDVWQVTRLTTGGTVIGLLENFPYQEERITLHPGDLLVAFTDGISEAMNPADEEFGEQRLLEVIEQCAQMKAVEVVAQIMRAADAFAAGASQHDDMTLVVLRVV